VERWWLLAIVACSTPAPTHVPVSSGAPLGQSPYSNRADPFDEASLAADVEWLAAPERKGRDQRIGARDTRNWLANKLVAARFKPVFQLIPGLEKTDVADEEDNVIAELGTSGPPVLIVAHYDHLGEGFPGANDNASGVAVALAVARAMPPGHVIFLFTGGEELGLRGARAYAARPTIDVHTVRAVFNLDMVGHDFMGTQQATLAGVGLSDHDDLGKLADEAAADTGLTLLPFSAAAVAMLGQDHRSDDWVFRDLGIPAVHFSTGLDDTYHQPTDTPDKIVPAQLRRTARFLYALVQRVNR
jgi:Zn-dependent M28 family amino/carboxypeptidase